MNDDILIQELDAAAGWEYAKQVEVQLAEVIEQRRKMECWSAYQQPKVDGFNQICLLLATVRQSEALTERIREIVQTQNAKAAAIERAQMEQGRSPHD